jgi:hypothetical protein
MNDTLDDFADQVPYDTYIQGIWTLTTVHEQMSHQITVDQLTPHMIVDAHHYECIDVSSDDC